MTLGRQIEKVGRSNEKTQVVRLVRFRLRCGDSPIGKSHDD
jgi:hypothetical protein